MKTKLTFTFFAFTFLFAAFESYNNQLPLLVGLITFMFISFSILFLLFIGGQNAYDELSNSFEFINKKYFDLIAKYSEITKSYNELCKNYSILSAKEIELKKELAKYNRNHDKATGKFCKKDGTFKPKVKVHIPISKEQYQEVVNSISKEQPYTIKGKSIKQLCVENLGIKIGIGKLCGYCNIDDGASFLVGFSNDYGWKLKTEGVEIIKEYDSYLFTNNNEVITAIKKHRNIK